VVCDPIGMVRALAGVAQAVLRNASAAMPALENAFAATPPPLRELLADVEPDEREKAIAEDLAKARQKTILLGHLAVTHPHFSLLRTLAFFIARYTGSRFGYLPEAANTAGAWLAGVVPHRLAGGKSIERPGLSARAMLEQPRKSYVLFGAEPEYDCDNPVMARAALDQAATCYSAQSPSMTAIIR
jgi:NADH-quinone oxidoreductase subunit G